MGANLFPDELVPHEDFQFHVRELAGSILIDFTGWKFNYVGRETPDSETALFSYTEADTGVIEIDIFSLTDDSGNALDYNLKVTTPYTKVAEIDDLGLEYVHIGLLATPPDGSPIQLIRNFRVRVSEAIAP